MNYCRTCGAGEDQDCKNGEYECDWIGISSEDLAKEITERLLPCPLCGGKPNETVFYCGVVRHSDYQIKCIACSLSINNDRQDKVIGIWNTRLTQPLSNNTK